MKLYVQTEILDAAGVAEPRPPVLLRQADVPAEAAEAALQAIVPKLGAVIAIPPAAHEANLKALLQRDLADLPAGEGPEGRVTLQVRRSPIEGAEGFNLAYAVMRA